MDTEISSAPALVVTMNRNVQAGISKNMVPDLRWFDGD